jgi:hypothetical protein
MVHLHTGVHMFVGFWIQHKKKKWIGRDGPTPWPPRSPDITPIDFFLWGYVNEKVLWTPVPDITNLKARITNAFAAITEDIPISRPTDATCDRFLFSIYMCITLHVSSVKRSSSGVTPRTYSL